MALSHVQCLSMSDGFEYGYRHCLPIEVYSPF